MKAVRLVLSVTGIAAAETKPLLSLERWRRDSDLPHSPTPTQVMLQEVQMDGQITPTPEGFIGCA